MSSRLGQLFEKLGMEAPAPRRTVGVVGLVRGEDEAKEFREKMTGQSRVPGRTVVVEVSGHESLVSGLDEAASTLKPQVLSLAIWDSQVGWETRDRDWRCDGLRKV